MTTKISTTILIGVGALLLLSVLYFSFPAGQYPFPRCIFHSVTGLDCPGCGSQRAASSLLHGRLFVAMDYNLLFVLLLPFVLYSVVAWAWNSWNPNKPWAFPLRSKIFVKLLICLLVIFWICRNIPIRPFTWLKA